MYHIQVKVLFTTSYFLPYISGLTVYADRISRELARRGYKVSVLTTRHRKDLPLREQQDGISVRRVPFLLQVSKGFLIPSYFRVAWDEVAKNDAVFVNLPQLEGIIPAFYGRLQGKKVYCIYNCEVFLPAGFRNWSVERLLLLITALTVSLADKVIIYTADYAAHSRVLPFFKSKLVVIAPPIITYPADKATAESLEKQLPKRRYTIGVAARLAAEKGLEYLFEALPDLIKNLGEETVIAIAGPPDPVGEAGYKRMIAPLMEKYRSRLYFLGALPPEKMTAFYNLLDVLVLPSVNSTEAFGMVQVEAMMRGVPVVASDLPGVRVPVQKTGMGEIVEPGNSSALAKAIINVLLNKDAYGRNKKNAEKEFALSKTITAYEELLGGVS